VKERHHLNGAKPNTTSGVFLEVYVGDADCTAAYETGCQQVVLD
jgi:hypothetical protein